MEGFDNNRQVEQRPRALRPAAMVGVFGLTCLAIYATVGLPGSHDSDRSATPPSTEAPASPSDVPPLPNPNETTTPTASTIPSAEPSVTTTQQTTPPRSQFPPATGLESCAPFTGNELEVCASYVVDTSELARQSLYKFGNNSVGLSASVARDYLEERYTGEPRDALLQQVNSWPQTMDILGNTVDQSIGVTSVLISPEAGRAIISSQESWRVTAPNGEVLYDEPLHASATTLCQQDSLMGLTEQWVVVSTTAAPDYDCQSSQ